MVNDPHRPWEGKLIDLGKNLAIQTCMCAVLHRPNANLLSCYSWNLGALPRVSEQNCIESSRAWFYDMRQSNKNKRTTLEFKPQ